MYETANNDYFYGNPCDFTLIDQSDQNGAYYGSNYDNPDYSFLTYPPYRSHADFQSDHSNEEYNIPMYPSFESDCPYKYNMFDNRDILQEDAYIFSRDCGIIEPSPIKHETPVFRKEFDQNNSRLSCSDEDSSHFEPQHLTIKRPGRPRTNVLAKRKPENRTGKLWEFLRNLLLDKETCPSLIKWDDYNEGTFKFVQSERVAQLWGNRKKNDKMNYEKLSRAMRYYYKSKVLLPVSGKRLVYKFGPQATGWRTANPILS